MGTRNHIGKTVYVCAALPATNDAAGFEALTWTKADGVISAFQFGVTHKEVEIGDLQRGWAETVKDMGSGSESKGEWRHVASDAGQAILRTLGNGATGVGSVKIVTGSGVNQAPVTGDAVEYAQGFFKDYVKNQISAGNYEGFSVGFKQNAVSIEATEPA